MSNRPYTAESILKVLDGPGLRGVDRCTLEPLCDEFFGGEFLAARLSCFAGPNTWRILLEKANYDVRRGLERHSFLTQVFEYSDQNAGQVLNLPTTEIRLLDHPSTENMFSEDGNLVDSCSTVYLRGLPVTIPNDPDNYFRAGIMKHDGYDSIKPPTGLEVGLYLASYYYELLFLSPQDLARHAGDGEVLVLHLTDWYHPRSPSEYPSDTACWRSIAEAMATSDPLRYSPPRVSNSNWRAYY